MKIITRSVQQTQELASKILKEKPRILILQGDLGAGKTIFVQGLAKALGIQDNVNSPSFVIIKEYQNKQKLVHIDLYRLKKIDQDLLFQIKEYLAAPQTIIAIEWGEKIIQHLSSLKYKIIKFKIISENEREIEF